MIYKVLFFTAYVFFAIYSIKFSVKHIKKGQKEGYPLLVLTVTATLMPIITCILNKYYL